MISKMDAVEHDLLCFFKQQIMQKLIEESTHQRSAPTHPELSKIVIHHFNLGPNPNCAFEAFEQSVKQLATTNPGEFHGFQLSLVIPQLVHQLVTAI